jgi:TonB family protein
MLAQPGTAAVSNLQGAGVPGEVHVTVGPDGTVQSATIQRSTNNAQMDQALLWAAKVSQYSPKVVNCAAVSSVYDYKFTFAPYVGNIDADTSRFTTFFTTLLSTKQSPTGPGIHLDPSLSAPVTLHLFALLFSTWAGCTAIITRRSSNEESRR